MQISYMKDGQTRSIFVQSEDAKVSVTRYVTCHYHYYFTDYCRLVHGHKSC